MEGTPGMETGVEVEADRQAFELALGTMVVLIFSYLPEDTRKKDYRRVD